MPPIARLFRWFSALAVVLFALLASRDAHAYAWMIRHDYAGCNSCHADPSGGGLLTSFGRMSGETMLRSRFEGGNPEDSDPGSAADFAFGAVKLPKALLLQADARLAYSWVGDKSFTKQVDRLIHMQTDVVGQYSIDRFRINASLGYLNTHDYLNDTGNSMASGPIWVTGGNSAFHVVSRHHWVGYDIGEDKSMLIRAGRMNLPFGLRMIEHDAFVRTATGSDINKAQQDGVSFAYNSEKVRAEIMGIVGNFQMGPDAYRSRGYAGYIEYAPRENLAVGFSSKVTRAERDLAAPTGPAYRHAHGFFGRWAPSKKLVFMGEGDVTVFSPKGLDPAKGVVGLAQADYEPIQGLHLIATGEVLDANVKNNNSPTQVGGWLSAHWYVVTHADVRLDFIHRESGANSASNTLFVQLHGYL